MPLFAAFEDELPIIMAKYFVHAINYPAQAFRIKLNLEHGLGTCTWHDETHINWVIWRAQQLLQVPVEPAVLNVMDSAVKWATFLALQDIWMNARKVPIQDGRLSKHDEVRLLFQHARQKALLRSVQVDTEARGSSTLALQDAEDAQEDGSLRAELGRLIQH